MLRHVSGAARAKRACLGCIWRALRGKSRQVPMESVNNGEKQAKEKEKERVH